MKAAVPYARRDLRITEVSKPIIASKELIRVKAVGICGTDLLVYKGDLPSTGNN